MTKQPVADDVRRFILTSIPSVPYLEALLLLRSEQQARWDATMLARRLYMPEAQAARLLQALASGGAASQVETALYSYRPTSLELSRAVDALAETYARDLVGVTDLIHSRLDRRAQQFADAFRWKKE